MVMVWRCGFVVMRLLMVLVIWLIGLCLLRVVLVLNGALVDGRWLRVGFLL